jgi:hypothetical protein
MTGAATGKLTTGAEAAAVAVEGPPASAATTINKMIAEPRFPDFLAISLSLSRQDLSNARRSDLSFEAHSVTPKTGVRPPSGGVAPSVPSFEGSSPAEAVGSEAHRYRRLKVVGLWFANHNFAQKARN